MTEQHEQTRDLASRAMRTAEDAERLAVAASHAVELLGQRMDHFEETSSIHRGNVNAALARIETGVAGLYRRGWNFALTITGGLFAAAGIIAGVAYWLGQTVGKIPTQ